jgi:MFS family permease
MVILDSQIVILGLPSIEADLGMSSDAAQWVMSAYLLSFGGLCCLAAARPICSGGVGCSWSARACSSYRR